MSASQRASDVILERRALVVDDDDLQSAIIAQYLEKQGIVCTIAADGRQALDLFIDRSPDVVIADIRMPVMDGIALLESIQKSGSAVPVIMTTGNPEMQSAISAIRHGAYDYILKPIHLPTLLHKIRMALEKGRFAQESSAISEMVSLYSITSSLSATRNKDALLDLIFKHGLETTASQRGAILLDEGRNGVLAYGRERGFAAQKDRSAPDEAARRAIAQQVFSSGRSVCVERGTVRFPDGAVLECGGIHALIAAPLNIQSKTIGVIAVERDEGFPPYSAFDVNRMELLASQAGIAINNAQLCLSLDRKLEDLELVSTFSEQIMGRTDRQELIRMLFDRAREHCAVDVIGYLSIQTRNHDFFYWTRGTINDADLRTMCRRLIEQVRETGGPKIDERRVTYKPLAGPGRLQGEVLLPLAHQRCVPVSWEGAAIGVFFLGGMAQRPEDDDREALVVGLINQLRIALVNAKLYNDMKQNYIKTIKALAIAVDAKDKYTLGHSEKVMLIAEELAREITEFDDRRIAMVRDAALLHDIGKIGIPGHILNKPGPLSFDEFNCVMKSHSTLGANIIKDVPFLEGLYHLILYHHEHFDGTGYPIGLKGEEIPLEARILHLADAFDAMTSDRPYRLSLGLREAVRRIIADSGKHFDPDLVGAFLRIVRRKGIIS